MGVSQVNGYGPVEAFRSKRAGGDVEAADFDESELDNLPSRRQQDRNSRSNTEPYSLGSDIDSDDEAEDGTRHKRRAGDGMPSER